MCELPSHSGLLKIVGILHEVRLAAAVARQPGGIQIESGSVSCRFQSSGSVTGDLIVVVGYPPRPDTIPLPGNICYWGRNQFGVT